MAAARAAKVVKVTYPNLTPLFMEGAKGAARGTLRALFDLSGRHGALKKRIYKTAGVLLLGGVLTGGLPGVRQTRAYLYNRVVPEAGVQLVNAFDRVHDYLTAPEEITEEEFMVERAEAGEEGIVIPDEPPPVINEPIARQPEKKTSPAAKKPAVITAVQSASPLSPAVLSSRQKYLPLVQKVARTSGIPADFLDKKILMESGYRASIQNRHGACGLLQIMPDTMLEVVYKHAANNGRPDLARLVTRYKDDNDRLRYRMARQPNKAAAKRAQAAINAACYDPELTLAMGADHMRQYMAVLEAEIGHPLSYADGYFLHQRGIGGAIDLIDAYEDAATRKKPVSTVTSWRAMNRNQGIYFETRLRPLPKKDPDAPQRYTREKIRQRNVEESYRYVERHMGRKSLPSFSQD